MTHSHGSLSPQLVTYAQNGEDLLLAALFANVKGGFYVTIGEQHPIASSTKLLYRAGWHGLTIGESEQLAQLARYDRPRDMQLVNSLGQISLKAICAERSVKSTELLVIKQPNALSTLQTNDWRAQRWIVICISAQQDAPVQPYLEEQHYTKQLSDGFYEYFIADEAAPETLARFAKKRTTQQKRHIIDSLAAGQLDLFELRAKVTAAPKVARKKPITVSSFKEHVKNSLNELRYLVKKEANQEVSTSIPEVTFPEPQLALKDLRAYSEASNQAYRTIYETLAADQRKTSEMSRLRRLTKKMHLTLYYTPKFLLRELTKVARRKVS